MTLSGKSPTQDGLDDEKRTILVVNDDEDGLFLIAHYLRQSFPTANILTASNGVDALAIWAKEGATAIVTDNQMPGMTGVMMARKIRETNGTVPIVMASGSTRYRDDAIQAGVTIFYHDTGLAGVTAALNECFSKHNRPTE
jgi:CheY-like chemotaxis protein